MAKFITRFAPILILVALCSLASSVERQTGASFVEKMRKPRSAQSPRTRLSLQRCDLPGVDGDARCGKYEVFEDREAKKGRKIGLNIVVLPALSETPAPDPVFWLDGGPGVAATGAAAGARAGYMARLRK